MPFLDDPDGRQVVVLNSAKGIDYVRCWQAVIQAGGMIVIQVSRDDDRVVIISPNAFDVCQVIPRDEFDAMMDLSQ